MALRSSVPLPERAAKLSALGINADGVTLESLIGETLMLTGLEWLNKDEDREGVRLYAHRVVGDTVETAQLQARGFTSQVRRLAHMLDALPLAPDGKWEHYPIVSIKREGQSYAVVSA